MSTGGIFTLITNDGKQDRMLMATALLRQRLEAVEYARGMNPNISDPTPTLLDIEKTHILFTNSHFKPFVAIGFEYNKVRAGAGSSTLDSQVTFSIPQFGDFFTDMVLYVKLKQPTLASSADDSNKPLMRWCPYPGERLLEQVEMEVNGNPLDKYTPLESNFHREFLVGADKKLGYDRCVGQEEVESGFVDQANWADSGLANSAITSRWMAETASGDQTPTGQKDVSVVKEMFIPLKFWFNRDVRLAVPSVSIPYGQRFIKVNLASGNKLVNMVPRGAGTWADGTSGVGDIGGTLTYDNMLQDIQLYINNIFVNPEVHNIFIKRIGFTLIRVHRSQTFQVSSDNSELHLQQLKWPIEYMFVGLRIKDYNSSTSALQRQHLDVWHTFAKYDDASRSAQGWRSGQVSLKDAAFGIDNNDVFNFSGTGTDQLRLTEAVVSAANVLPYPDLASGDIMTIAFTVANSGVATPGTLVLEVAGIVASDGTVAGYVLFKQLVQDASAIVGITPGTASSLTASVSRVDSAELSATVKTCTKTIDNLTIRAHGIALYDNFQSTFFNAYLPYTFGGPNVVTPKDCGALFINFALYPGSYQPSGHINISRAREFYIEYSSSVISSSVEGQLVVSASALNFLLISDGSAVLRYTT